MTSEGYGDAEQVLNQMGTDTIRDGNLDIPELAVVHYTHAKHETRRQQRPCTRKGGILARLERSVATGLKLPQHTNVTYR